MTRYCIVPNCVGEKNRSVFKAPKHVDRRLKWLKAIWELYPDLDVKGEFRVCEKHFRSTDFTSCTPDSRETQHTRKRLKYRAVPNFDEPKEKPEETSTNSIIASTMADAICETPSEYNAISTNLKVDKTSDKVQICRACLGKLGSKESFCDVFQRWAPPWDGMQPTIAEEIAKLTNVKISETDKHSHIICCSCYVKLLQACQFIKCVQDSDMKLSQIWPEPIKVDTQVFIDVDVPRIKQELLSDDENAGNYCGPSQKFIVDTDLEGMEIKIEPEEFVQPSTSSVTASGDAALEPELENLELPSVSTKQDPSINEQCVKVEPPTEEEDVTPDLPLECILCSKTFHSVQGLKAHVIAHHSYKSVKRKTSSSPRKKKSNDRHQCGACRRIFHTRTDLMVHETCHNKHTCFACTLKFDTFNMLTKHRKRCKAIENKGVQKHKTLEDVVRPVNNVLKGLSESLESSPFANVKLESLVSTKITDSSTEISEAKNKNNSQNGLINDENIQSEGINGVLENENLDEDLPDSIDSNNDAMDIQIDVEMMYPYMEKEDVTKTVNATPNCVDKTELLNENSFNKSNVVNRVNFEVDVEMESIDNSADEVGANSPLELNNSNQYSEESATSIGIKISRIESIIGSMEGESDIPNSVSVHSKDNYNLESDKDISETTAENMHLHLEILDNSDSEPEVIQDSELPVDSLKSDDCM